MKMFFVSLLITGLLTYPAIGNAQTDGVFNNEETGLGNGHSPFDNNTNHEEKALDFDQTQTPMDAPIDGGLSILLIAGAAYGVKRVAGDRKTKVPLKA